MPSRKSIIRAHLKVIRSARPVPRGEQDARSVPLRAGECECESLSQMNPRSSYFLPPQGSVTLWRQVTRAELFAMIEQPRCRRACVEETSGVSLCAFGNAVEDDGEQLLQGKSFFSGYDIYIF